APVTIPTVLAGLATTLLVEKLGWFSYGAQLPDNVRRVMQEYEQHESSRMTVQHRQVIITQAVVAVLLLLALAFHWAEVGIVGLMVIVLATAFTGIIEEGRIGKAFESALPFAALLVVFFVIV